MNNTNYVHTMGYQPIVNVKIKLLYTNSVMPAYAKQGDAGLDLTVSSVEFIDHEHVKYDFGISLEIPFGHVGLVFPRSSIYKHGQLLSNAVGVIDSGYRGSVSAVMLGTSEKSYKVGDRAAQLIIMPYPSVVFEEVEKLSDSDRGNGGYGSSGR